MLHNLKKLVQLGCQITRKCVFRTSFYNENVTTGSKCNFLKNQEQNFHTNTPRNSHADILEVRRAQKEAAGKLFMQEEFVGDIAKKRKEGYFPTVDLPETSFNGTLFKNLPIIYIKVSRNNTIISLTENGLVKVYRSCGVEGFKNAKKGTNVAAQATGTSFGLRAVKKGFKTARVIIYGLGPGRLSSVKGLQLGGMDIVSITDFTTDKTSLRPRKQKRL